jgi:hypothetical protein
MTPSLQLEVKMKAKNNLRPEMVFAQNYMKYGHLAVFIRHNSAEIWGFRYGLTLGIGTLIIMACTGVFVRVICALKLSISCDSQT